MDLIDDHKGKQNIKKNVCLINKITWFKNEHK